MKLYIVTFSHRHGADVWPRFVADNDLPPSLDDEIQLMGDIWEGEERGDYLEISEPFQVPANTGALQRLIDTVEATGGLLQYPAESGPVLQADEEWLDMADVYLQACKELGRAPKLRAATKEDAS